MTLYQKRSTIYEATFDAKMGAFGQWTMTPCAVNGLGVEIVTPEMLERDWEAVPINIGTTPPSAVTLETTAESASFNPVAEWLRRARLRVPKLDLYKVSPESDLYYLQLALKCIDALLANAAKAGDVRQGEIEAWLRAFKGDGPFNTTSCHALADALASGAWRGGAK